MPDEEIENVIDDAVEPVDEPSDTVVAAEGDDSIAGGDAVEPVIEKTPEPEVIQKVVPATPPVADQPPKSPAQLRLEELETKIDDEFFDANSKDGKAILKEHARVCAKVESEPAVKRVHDATIWTELAEEYDFTVKEIKQAWTDTKKGMPDEFKNNQGATDFAFVQRLKKMQQIKAAPKTPKAAAQVLSPGQVLPRGAGSVPKQPSEPETRTIEERVLAGDKSILRQFKDAYTSHFGRNG